MNNNKNETEDSQNHNNVQRICIFHLSNVTTFSPITDKQQGWKETGNIFLKKIVEFNY